MNIHIIVVAYALAEDLHNLYESVENPTPGPSPNMGRGENLRTTWHVFLHSRYPDVVAECYTLQQRGNVWLYPYGENRGLARSWNEGLYNAYLDGADVALIANDDALAGPGDVERIAKWAVTYRQWYLVTGQGEDLREKQRGNMCLALAAINPIALERIGFFDTTFRPIYYEDIDYYRRAQLAGLESFCLTTTHIVHKGSASMDAPGQRELHEQTFRANRDYYVAKWGGDRGEETFEHPFNDARLSLFIDREGQSSYEETPA